VFCRVGFVLAGMSPEMDRRCFCLGSSSFVFSCGSLALDNSSLVLLAHGPGFMQISVRFCSSGLVFLRLSLVLCSLSFGFADSGSEFDRVTDSARSFVANFLSQFL